jgi:hypothetical protein
MFGVVEDERSRVMVIDVPLTRFVIPDGYCRKDELGKGFFYSAS